MIFSDFELLLLGAFLGIAIMYFKQRIRNDMNHELLYHLSRIIAGVADGELAIKRTEDTIHIIKTKDIK